jgi:hypothetical protein
MKSLYIIAFLALSANIYAQQDKKVSETQEAPNYKESKEFEARMMKEAQERAAQKPSTTTLASEQGLEAKKQKNNKLQSRKRQPIQENYFRIRQVLKSF